MSSGHLLATVATQGVKNFRPLHKNYGFTHLGLLQATLKHLKEHGIWKTTQHLRMTDEVDFDYGTLVGVDKFGNKYYEEDEAVAMKHRRVVYGQYETWNASDVPAEWHGWLHHIQPETPVAKPPGKVKFKVLHQPNGMSQMGSEANYLPPGHYNNSKLNFKDISKPKYKKWTAK